jgi:hypothetical protein
MSNNTDNNNEVKNTEFGVCDVHRLVHKDYETREVKYCGFCDAWMCFDCWNNLPKRAYAMVIKKARGE